MYLLCQVQYSICKLYTNNVKFICVVLFTILCFCKAAEQKTHYKNIIFKQVLNMQHFFIQR